MKKTQSVYKDQDFIPLDETTFRREGFEIVGWNTEDQRDSEQTDYYIGEKIPGMPEDTRLYACWRPDFPPAGLYLIDHEGSLIIDMDRQTIGIEEQ